VEEPVRCKSKLTQGPPSSTYDAQHQEAATKIGAAARGSRARQQAQNTYKIERKPVAEQEVNPLSVGLGDYAETRVSMPRIQDRLRYEVRDITMKRVLEDLGYNVEQNCGRYFESADFMSIATQLLKEVAQKEGVGRLGPAVKKQMGRVHLFAETQQPPTNSNSSSARPRVPSADSKDSTKSLESGYKIAPEEQYLLGKFDVVAVPARADFDCAFREYANARRDDCSASDGFPGWFWVIHSAAPNIGESALADDFLAYSREEDNVPPNQQMSSASVEGNGKKDARCCWKDKPERPTRSLDEDLYIADMGKLWRNTLRVFKRLQIDDVIMFPFGMGAFLRHLDQNDDKYSDPTAMRKLRRRIADELMAAIDEICVAPTRSSVPGQQASQAPPNVHLCLVCINPESIENHNVFVEAAAERAKTCKELKSTLQIRRNTDSLQLAHELSKGRSLKVGLMNGANRKLCGNHWFQSGARFAIDENLHRRSAAMSRAALLLNCAVEPCKRKPGCLAQTVEYFSGTVVPIESLMPGSGGYKPSAPSQPSPAAAAPTPVAPPAGKDAIPPGKDGAPPTQEALPCLRRVPVKGDMVLAADDRQYTAGIGAKAWTLPQGGIAIVAKVDKKGDIFLRNPSGAVSKTAFPRRDFVYAKDDVQCKCSLNVPLKGDRVTRADGKETTDTYTWKLAAGEIATVSQLDKFGGFKLKNTAGQVSKTLLPCKDFVHAKVQPVADQPKKPEARKSGGFCGCGSTKATEPSAKAPGAAPKAAAAAPKAAPPSK
jgi:hypothetical protein